MDSAIIIGNRLLVNLAEAGAEGCTEEHLPVLVGAGKQVRDEKGLDRFRLALVADEPEVVRQAAEKLFEELRGTDGKVHLHVIKKSEIPFTAEGAEGSRNTGQQLKAGCLRS